MHGGMASFECFAHSFHVLVVVMSELCRTICNPCPTAFCNIIEALRMGIEHQKLPTRAQGRAVLNALQDLLQQPCVAVGLRRARGYNHGEDGSKVLWLQHFVSQRALARSLRHKRDRCNSKESKSMSPSETKCPTINALRANADSLEEFYTMIPQEPSRRLPYFTPNTSLDSCRPPPGYQRGAEYMTKGSTTTLALNPPHSAPTSPNYHLFSAYAGGLHTIPIQSPIFSPRFPKHQQGNGSMASTGSSCGWMSRPSQAIQASWQDRRLYGSETYVYMYIYIYREREREQNMHHIWKQGMYTAYMYV